MSQLLHLTRVLLGFRTKYYLGVLVTPELTLCKGPEVVISDHQNIRLADKLDLQEIHAFWDPDFMKSRPPEDWLHKIQAPGGLDFMESKLPGAWIS